LGEPDRFGGLQCGCRRLQLLQSGNPINPHRIRHLTYVWEVCALGNAISQAGQHPIEPTGQRISDQIRNWHGNHSNCHASDVTDRH
jgi:hypothetical protein